MLVLEKQVAFARKILELIEKEAPRDATNIISQPFRGWANQLRMDVEKGEGWITNGVFIVSLWKSPRGKAP